LGVVGVVPVVCGPFAGVWASFASALVAAAVSGSGSVPSPSRAESRRISASIWARSAVSRSMVARSSSVALALAAPFAAPGASSPRLASQAVAVR